MKKTLMILLALMLVFALAACNGGTTPPPAPPPANGDNGDNGDAEELETWVITSANAQAEAMTTSYFFFAFAEEVYEESNGRIIVNHFPAAQLGGDREINENTQIGAIQITGGSIAGHVHFVPDLAIFDMQYVFPDLASARRMRDDPVVFDSIQALYAEANFHLLGFTDSAFRYLTANFEIRTPADMAGFTTRSSANVYHLATWEALGANPTPLPIAELYIGLQQGVVEGQDSGIEYIWLWGFYEIQQYLIALNHFYHINAFIMNADFYNDLPADMQAAVDRAASTALQRTQTRYNDHIDEWYAALEDLGRTFVTLTPEEHAQFREIVVEAVWPMIEADVSPETFSMFMAAVDRALR
jgi:tripartite ATP-independent transporter DctP family solute receptor